MADISISSIIVIATFFVIFGVFLLFDLFGRNEKGAYFAYIVAVIPVNIYWGLGYHPVIAYIILFVLWDITLLRDTIAIYLKKDKEINEILLYLFLGIIIQIIASAILPEVNESLQDYTEKVLYFWLPNIHSAIFAIESITLGFKLAATLLVLLVIVPLIIDIKEEEIPLPVLIVFVALFILPFMFVSFLWVPEAYGVFAFLLSVILFVVLLLITRSGLETK